MRDFSIIGQCNFNFTLPPVVKNKLFNKLLILKYTELVLT